MNYDDFERRATWWVIAAILVTVFPHWKWAAVIVVACVMATVQTAFEYWQNHRVKNRRD